MKTAIPFRLALCGILAVLPFGWAAADPAPPPARTIAFLGVETSEAPAVLADQLGLAEGTGLVVVSVVPESAASSVLKRHDILLKLDDQILIEPSQLAVLVRNHKVGDAVSLTYLRAGRPGTVTVRLGRHAVPEMTEEDRLEGGPLLPFDLHGQVFDPSDLDRLLQDHDLDRQDMDRILGAINGAFGPRWNPNPAPLPPAGTGSSVDAENSRIVYSDDHGTLVLSIRHGRKTLLVDDAKGKQLFSGPIDTPEERKALPPDILTRLGRLEGMNALDFQAGPGFHGTAGVARPEDQGLAGPPPPAPASTPFF